uniref:Uncharacterized protein n=1 Tax=Setaria italica TaxID=4555 RepID=K3XP21_SETIT
MTQLYPNQLLILKVCFTLQAAIGRGSLERSCNCKIQYGSKKKILSEEKLLDEWNRHYSATNSTDGE